MVLGAKICYYKGMRRILSFITLVFICGSVVTTAFPVAVQAADYVSGDNKTEIMNKCNKMGKVLDEKKVREVDTPEGKKVEGSCVEANTSTRSNGSNPKCEHTFLGLRPWYTGLVGGDNCVVIQPAGDKLASFAWRIILNISADIALIVGYAALGFIIYGGYKYIMSSGDPGNVKKAKQTILNAVIGLIIAILAAVIVNTIIAVIGNAAYTY